MGKAKVLFLCVHNSARSQIAEGLLRARYGDRYEVASAGTAPWGVHPEAVAAMAELGIDISGQRSRHVRDLLGQTFDYVVTLCGDDAPGACPFFPGGKVYLHVPFPDPAAGADPEERRAAFRRVRDAIGAWIDVAFGPERPETTGAR